MERSGASLLLVVRTALIAFGLLFLLHLPNALGPAVDTRKVLGWWASPRVGSEFDEPVIVRTLWHASRAGLHAGDVILELNGEQATMERVKGVRAATQAGDTVRLTVLHGTNQHSNAVPVLDSSPSYAGYRWYRLGLAIVAWLIAMAIIALRGNSAETLLLGGSLLLIGPVTAPITFVEGNALLWAANYVWHLAGGVYRFLLPLLLFLFLLRHSSRRDIARSPSFNLFLCAASVIIVALLSDGFTRPLAWASPGFHQHARTAAGLTGELLALSGTFWISRDLRESSGPIRWVAFAAGLVLVTGAALSLAMIGLPGSPDLIDALRQVKALTLALLPISAALYVLIPTSPDPAGDWRARLHASAAASTLLAALYGFAVAGAAAVALSVLGISLGGAEIPLFASIFIATIIFSPVLRWSRDMIDRQVFAGWMALEQKTHVLVHDLNADLEPNRIAERLRNSLPLILSLRDVNFIVAAEVVQQWRPVEELKVRQEPRAVLEQLLVHSDERGLLYEGIRRNTGELLGVLQYRLPAGRQALAQPECAALDAAVRGIAVALRNTESYFELQKANHELAENQRVTSLAVMAGALAHEIKNPLASLKMGLYLLRRDDADSARLRRIEDDVRRIDDLLSSLLRYNQADVQDAKVPLDIRDAVRSAVSDLTAFAHDRGVRVEESYPAEPTIVMGGPSEARILFSTILRNSLDACAAGGRVTVAVRSDSRQVEVQVEDDGHGIPQKLRRRVFDLSFSTKPGGTGLGLALARREVERLGGRIQLEPQSLRGTALRVVLPVAEVLNGGLPS